MRQSDNANDNANDNATRFSPSDDDLIHYLLGSSSVELKAGIEAWLATDKRHSDRLVQYAAIILVASEAPLESEVSVVDRGLREREWVSTNAVGLQLRRRHVMGLLAIAATISWVIFSIRGFQRESMSDGRVAMAWAESLPIGGETESVRDMPDWLIDDGPPNDVSDISSPDVLGDSVLGDGVLGDSDIAESESWIGFSSDEPPEWMLAALGEMQTASVANEDAAEVVP
jgi:hypothetical protein